MEKSKLDSGSQGTGEVVCMGEFQEPSIRVSITKYYKLGNSWTTFLSFRSRELKSRHWQIWWLVGIAFLYRCHLAVVSSHSSTVTEFSWASFRRFLIPFVEVPCLLPNHQLPPPKVPTPNTLPWRLILWILGAHKHAGPIRARGPDTWMAISTRIPITKGLDECVWKFCP